MSIFEEMAERNYLDSRHGLYGEEVPTCVFCDEPIEDESVANCDLRGDWAHDACDLKDVA